MRVLVASTADQASITIKKCLLDLFSFSSTGEMFDGEPVLKLDDSNADIRLITTQKPPVEANHLESQFQPELFVFITKHRSETGRPGLLTHVTGNWSDRAEVGGEPKSLGVAPGYAVRVTFRTLFELVKARKIPFKVDLEVTHHGPTSLSTPLLFVELGSTEKEWGNEDAGNIAALAAVEASKAEPDGETVIGFGGGHYCPRFADLLQKTPLNIAHIAPKYVLDELDEEMILKAIERSATPISGAVIDQKGTLLPQREKLASIFSSLDFELRRADHVIRDYQKMSNE